VRRTLEIPVREIEPTREALLRALGGPDDRPADARVERLLAEALEELRSNAEPRGMFAEVGAREFASIYEGAGDNDVPSPLAEIFPRADLLALFAVTVGAGLSERIAALFDEGSPALGATLDAAASEATELAAVHLDHVVVDEALGQGRASERTALLRYSPGYCGWNLTGQRALFAALHPETIGISLTESCLMEPLKSISGVMVLGLPEIHGFDNDYPFCSECRTKDCRRRIQAVARARAEGDADGNPERDRL
jgi:hypothetical protein